MAKAYFCCSSITVRVSAALWQPVFNYRERGMEKHF